MGPESVYSVALPLIKKEAAMTVGSRYCEGGSVGFEWSLVRRVISQGATLLAIGVTNTSDPMSGFFTISKQSVIVGTAFQCNPIGFKIALELGCVCNLAPVRDVPIAFRERNAGESKMTGKQMLEYIQQLGALYAHSVGRGDSRALAVCGAVLLLVLTALAVLLFLLQRLL